MLFTIADPFDCGATIGCGGDGWLISDSTLSAFVVNATCSDPNATPFSALTALNCKCPAVSISPCSCQPTTDSSTTLTISCAAKSLTDSGMKTIVNKIPATTPVDTMDLSSNQLTQIPKGLTQFAQLANLNLSLNAITAVNSGDLSLKGTVTNLDMSSNAITTIADSSLPGEMNELLVEINH